MKSPVWLCNRTKTAGINIGILQKTGSRKGARYFSFAPKTGANSRPGTLRGQKNSLYRFAIKTNLSTRSFLWAGKPFLFDVVEFSNNSPCFFRRFYNFARLRFFRRNNPVRGQARDVHYRIPKFFAYQHYRNILFFTRFYQG